MVRHGGRAHSQNLFAALSVSIFVLLRPIYVYMLVMRYEKKMGENKRKKTERCRVKDENSEGDKKGDEEGEG